jgi:hypothetical protein
MIDPELFRRYDALRSAAEQVQSQFKDRHDHYVFDGSMNDVEHLRDTIDAVESYMIENNIEPPEADDCE